jgi:hypothetical protein
MNLACGCSGRFRCGRRGLRVCRGHEHHHLQVNSI